MNKYGAKKVHLDGHIFASKREARYYSDFKLLQQAGEITQLEIHPSFQLTVNGQKIGRYTADFSLREKDGRFRVIDVKSPPTAKGEAFRLRKKLVEALYPHVTIEIVY